VAAASGVFASSLDSPGGWSQARDVGTAPRQAAEGGIPQKSRPGFMQRLVGAVVKCLTRGNCEACKAPGEILDLVIVGDMGCAREGKSHTPVPWCVFLGHRSVRLAYGLAGWAASLCAR